MKNIVTKLLLSAAVLLSCLQPNQINAGENRGHHQSGITGRVAGGLVVATPTGEGSHVVPDLVRVYSSKGELIAEVETEVEGNDWWHFEITLKPGQYVITASTPGGSLFSYPVNVTVEKKGFANVVLTFQPV